MRRLSVVLSCSVVFAFAAPLFAAEPETPRPEIDSGEAEARTEFEHGVEALRNADFIEAEARFRRSRSLVDKPSTTYDLALALFKLGRNAECRKLLGELFAATKADDEYRGYGQTLLERLNERVAQLNLVVMPNGAVVSVDGATIGGARALTIDPGEHRVVVSALGYLGSSRTVTLAAGERQTLTFALVPARPEPEQAPPPPPPPPSSPSHVGPWLLMGVGGAALAASLVTYILQKNADDNFVAGCPTNRSCDPSLAPYKERAADFYTATTALWISGSALVAAGAAWYIIPTFQRSQTGGVDTGLAVSARF